MVAWSLGALVSWSLGVLVSWCLGLWSYWPLDLLASLSLVSWFLGLLVSWSLGLWSLCLSLSPTLPLFFRFLFLSLSLSYDGRSAGEKRQSGKFASKRGVYVHLLDMAVPNVLGANESDMERWGAEL